MAKQHQLPDTRDSGSFDCNPHGILALAVLSLWSDAVENERFENRSLVERGRDVDHCVAGRVWYRELGGKAARALHRGIRKQRSEEPQIQRVQIRIKRAGQRLGRDSQAGTR